MRGMTAPAFPYLHQDFGIEILDIDLQDAQSDAVWSSLRDSLARHALLVLRKQKLTHEAMQRAALRFGSRHGVVQRVETRGPSENQEWHCTEALEGAPAIATVLCAREAPPQDGGMEFVSTRAAFAALCAAEQQKLLRATGSHVFRAEPERVCTYPLVVTHPHTEQRSLFIGAHLVRIAGIAAAESERLVRQLVEGATQPERIYHHDFRPDDVLIWENASLMHRACALRPGEKRVVEEISVYAE